MESTRPMKVNKILFIALVICAVVTTISSITLYQSKGSNNVTTEALNVCVESLKESNNLINNCSAAYDTFGSCVSNTGSCDYEQTQQELQTMNEEKNRIQNRINQLTQELLSISEDK
jgi:peptidoglycan hydrolase CwlO-like protein